MHSFDKRHGDMYAFMEHLDPLIRRSKLRIMPHIVVDASTLHSTGYLTVAQMTRIGFPAFVSEFRQPIRARSRRFERYAPSIEVEVEWQWEGESPRLDFAHRHRGRVVSVLYPETG